MIEPVEKPTQPASKGIKLWRILTKSLLLFLALNLVFMAANPMPGLNNWTVYNHLVPGRKRLPYGDNPAKSYNVTFFQLDQMLASHEISSRPKPVQEFRVLMIGDSATWGYLLTPSQTLTETLNRMGLTTLDGKNLRFYNLGYPSMSLTKDILLLSRGFQYQPDLILWPLTLESFPVDSQLKTPLVQENQTELQIIGNQAGLKFDPSDFDEQSHSFLANTWIGQRRQINTWFRYQLYGFIWAATGIDQDIPAIYPPRQEDLPNDRHFHEKTVETFSESDLALTTLSAGIRLAGNTPIILINEPIFVSHGLNSNVRYNFYYPRWAYDRYLKILNSQCQKNDWLCLELWSSISPDDFTNTAIHMNPDGTQQTAELIAIYLQNWLQKNK